MVLKLSYESDPEIGPTLIPFNAVIDSCQVSELIVPQDSALIYTVSDEEINIKLESTQSPDCGLPLQYTGAVVETGGSFPEFITLDSELGQLTIFTEDSSTVGIYEILLKASVEQDQEVTGSFQVTIVV